MQHNSDVIFIPACDEVPEPEELPEEENKTTRRAKRRFPKKTRVDVETTAKLFEQLKTEVQTKASPYISLLINYLMTLPSETRGNEAALCVRELEQVLLQQHHNAIDDMVREEVLDALRPFANEHVAEDGASPLSVLCPALL